MDHATTSRVVRQELGSFARQQVSARTVRPRLQQHGLSARISWLRLHLTLHNRQKRLQGVWSMTNLGARMLHESERVLAACIRHRRHTGKLFCVMVWDAIVYTSWSSFVRTGSLLNSARYISAVLRPVDLPFIQTLRNPTFQQDNTQSHVAGIERTFLNTENVQLLPWPGHVPDLSPIVNVWSIVAVRMVWLITIRQSLWLMSCGIVLKLNWHLSVYMLSNLCLTRCPGM
ncbi:transposable element Tcb1 transposase [Trichonephila clavipes]|nr:transposable element Tcb1 transposase [Trichonephila clavipes]